MVSHPQLPSAVNTDPEGDARRQLFARFQPALVKFFARRIRVETRAEDLAQETLLRVLKAQAFDEIQDAEKYVFRVAINQLRNYRDRVERLERLDNAVDFDDAAESEPRLVEDLSPERVLMGRDSLAVVLRALSQLDERTRNIFVLFRLENMKQKDIAGLYGIGQSTVEKHVMKATAHLLALQGNEERP